MVGKENSKEVFKHTVHCPTNLPVLKYLYIGILLKSYALRSDFINQTANKNTFAQ
jgi:hypothetical protein